MSTTPGFIIYQDSWNSDMAEDYTDEELGAMFRAMLKYFDTGEITEFSDRAMKRCFAKVYKNIEKNKEQYNNSLMQREYNRYCKLAKRNGDYIDDFDTWLQEHEQSCASHGLNS